MLDRFDLAVDPGQRVLLAGPSGSGKSTLLRAIAGLLLTAETGDLSGDVRVDGGRPEQRPGRVGLLLQDPTAACVAERVGRDVAFGPENLGLSRRTIWERVHEALARVGFPYGVDHPTAALSGGESQRLALAGALALEPGVLLLDEPTSMLDSDSAEQVRRAVLEVVAERGSTMVVVEHRIDPWLDHVDRLVVLGAHGEVVADGDPRGVLAEQGARLVEQGVWVPGHPDPEPLAVPLDLVEPWAETWAGSWDVPGHVTGSASAAEPLVVAERVSVRYRPRLGARGRSPGHAAPGPRLALDGVSAELNAGEALAVTGSSGAGKSTLVSLLAGLRGPDSGNLRAGGRLAHGRVVERHGHDPARWPSAELARRIAWVPQIPEHGLVSTTVADEAAVTSRAVGRDPHRSAGRVGGLLDALGLGEMRGRNPHHLSGGEQRRLVLAAALAHGPDVLLLDEPTVGQDRNTWAAVLGCALAARRAGVAVGAASHDAALLDALDGRVLHLAGGREVVA